MRASRPFSAYKKHLHKALDMALMYEQELTHVFYKDYLIRQVARKHNVPYHLARSVIAHGQEVISAQIRQAVYAIEHYLNRKAA